MFVVSNKKINLITGPKLGGREGSAEVQPKPQIHKGTEDIKKKAEKIKNLADAAVKKKRKRVNSDESEVLNLMRTRSQSKNENHCLKQGKNCKLTPNHFCRF